MRISIAAFTILAALSFAPVFGQKPRTLQPIRVEVVAQADGDDATELSRLVRAELRKTGDVVAATNNADFVVRLVSTRDDECNRYVVATLVITRSSGRVGVSIDTGRSLSGIAERLASKMNTDYFNPRRNSEEKK